MIRPSMLNHPCGLAPALAEAHPETSGAAMRGTSIHAEIVRAWNAGEESSVPEALAATKWIAANCEGELRFEQHVSLIDSDSMETITEGTPDLVVLDGAVATVYDWKTGRSENVTPADDNLQLIAYGLASCDGGPFRVCLVFLDGDKVDPRYSRTFDPSEHAALLGRVKAAAVRKPEAHAGDWCGSCYQRQYCHAWRAQLSTALALVDGDKALAVTDENAGQIMARAKAVKEAAEIAEDMIKAHVRAGGICEVNGKVLALGMCKGRESADVKALKDAGLVQYLKQGADYERATWKKAT